ncbi:MAG: efflux RND transporter periplasmic adaptor subunit [Myxococcota bacterium]
MTTRRKARLGRAAALLAATVLVLLIECEGGSDEQPIAPEPEPVSVQTTPASLEEVDTHYVATATIRGRTTAVLTARTMGNVRALHAAPGDRVEAGTLLVELEAEDVQAGLEEARAAKAEAEAGITTARRQLEATRAALGLAEVTRGRLKRLESQGAVTKQRLDEAEANLQTAEARKRQADAGLRAARARSNRTRAAIEAADARVGHRRIEAPFAGQVVSRSVDVGDMAAPGVPLMTLEEAGVVRAEAVIDESLAGRVRVGDPAEVIVEAVDERFTGNVGEVVPAVDAASRTFVVKVDLPADEIGTTLPPGMFARVRLRIGTGERLLIPASALSPKGQLDRVFVADPEAGRARLRMVTIGGERGDRLEVLSGLEPGEPVIVEPPSGLRDGAPVEVGP